MAIKLGLEGKLYRNAGSSGSPSWTEIVNVTDVTTNLTKATADVTSRANDGWRAQRGTLKEGEITFEMFNDGGADFAFFMAAYLANDVVELLALDGPESTPGNQGLRATFDVVDMTRTEALEEGQKYSVKLVVTTGDNAPEWYTS